VGKKGLKPTPPRRLCFAREGKSDVHGHNVGGLGDCVKWCHFVAEKLTEMISKYAIICAMNSKQRKTLAAVFANPTLKNIIWADIELLLISAGCELIEGNGSRVAFKFNQLRVDFHRPHPGKEAKPYQVKAASAFLIQIGVAP
jgi:hypothetical protein